MRKLSSNEWMKECPYHIILEDTEIEEAIEWCLETLEPREWHLHEELVQIKVSVSTIKRVNRYAFAFKHKKHALMFKLMWWNV